MILNSLKSVNSTHKRMGVKQLNSQCQNLLYRNLKNSHLISHPQISHQGLLFMANYRFFKNQVTIDYKKDYYQILKVKQTAPLLQIKKSFYKLAKQSHPDTSKGNEQIFKKINQAYNVVSHQQRRKLYDLNRYRKQTSNFNNNVNTDFNSAKQSAQPSSTHKSRQQRDQEQEESYKQSQQYAQRTQQAYYHHSRGQWQQFRSGYKYHVTPKREYYAHMTNNIPNEKLFQNMRSRHANKSNKQEEFLQEMEKYFEYVDKINQKHAKDMEDYHRKMEQMEKQMNQKRKQAFKKTVVGRTILKIQDTCNKLSEKLQKFFTKQVDSQKKK